MQSETVQTHAQPMIYVRYTVGMDSADIGRKMGEAFQTLGQFIGQNAIAPAGPPLAVYHDYTDTGMTMDVGFPVAAAALGKAAGAVKAGATPSGKARKYLHKGPYDTLRDTYGEIQKQFEAEGTPMSPVCWEVYLSDPDSTPEADLVTEIFMKVD